MQEPAAAAAAGEADGAQGAAAVLPQHGSADAPAAQPVGTAAAVAAGDDTLAAELAAAAAQQEAELMDMVSGCASRAGWWGQAIWWGPAFALRTLGGEPVCSQPGRLCAATLPVLGPPSYRAGAGSGAGPGRHGRRSGGALQPHAALSHERRRQGCRAAWMSGGGLHVQHCVCPTCCTGSATMQIHDIPFHCCWQRRSTSRTAVPADTAARWRHRFAPCSSLPGVGSVWWASTLNLLPLHKTSAI